MTVQETVQQLQHAPLTYRIQVMELLLQSLKTEIAQNESFPITGKPFRVRLFNLGADIDIIEKKCMPSGSLDHGTSGLYTVNTKDFEEFKFLDITNPL